jgi:acetyl/propionyl-CoA carboxylase alpha subunit
LAELKAAAKREGFPLLLKASAGGGGKGMRRVDREKDLSEAAESAAAEAQSAFGDGTLFIERLVENPRHIEVQVFGNGKGGAVHLYERECSLQRRHQKIWEEAPAPHLPEKTRQGLVKSALNLVRATKYRSAGTIEFLVDEKGRHYFLEMNTRLQVEHPVTEAITGIDLVRAQIELALTGKSLAEVESPRGHAIEVRLYAEDPSQGFVPAPGRIARVQWPTGPGIRVDSGIEEGQTITTLFDSMLAKLIVWGVDRDHALARLRFALDQTVIFGVGTNQAYLRLLCDDENVRKGRVDTGFLAREFGDFTGIPGEEGLSALAALQGQGMVRTGSSTSGTSAGGGEKQYPSPWFGGQGSSR